MGPKDFEQIRDRYAGSPEGQKWMLTRYMGEDSDGSNLHYAASLMTAKKVRKFVKSSEIAIIGYFRRENDLQHKLFSEAIWQLHRDIDRDDIGASVSSVTMQSVAKKEKAQVPSIVVYVDGKAVEDDGAFVSEKWTTKALIDFLRQFLPLTGEDDGAKKEIKDKAEL